MLDANLEVRSSVAYATFAVVLVFFPILALSGVAGRLFAPLGIAYILAVLASLAVALTVTPALSMLLLTGSKRPGIERSASRPLEPPSLQGHAGSHRAFSEAGYRDRDRPHDRRRGDVAVLRQHLPARSEGRTPDPARRRHARYLARRVAAHRQADKRGASEGARRAERRAARGTCGSRPGYRRDAFERIRNRFAAWPFGSRAGGGRNADPSGPREFPGRDILDSKPS